jgi:SAM-dependent methyltransferase
VLGWVPPGGTRMPVMDTAMAKAVLARAPGLSGMYHRYSLELDRLVEKGHVKAGDIAGKRILDWECGAGVYSLLFLERGAARCDAIDSWLQPEACRQAMGHLEAVRFEKVSLEEFAADGSRHGQYDFVFANTVTEHMLDLPKQLPVVGRLLREGGLFVTNHDNYYQPAGSHDHGFVFYGNGAFIESKGPKCWESAEKCAVSEAHRKKVMKDLWWTWDERMEKKLTPTDCTKCPYYKRSQPWAHLTYQGEFRELFPQVGFTTGYAKSSLNKVTPFQLKQFVIEAGFEIASWIQNKVTNQAPEHLMKPPFNFAKEDLETCTITVVARKGKNPYGE